MRKTFVCDESMIITIPIGSLRDAQEGRVMPENFHCVFKDSYKVFVLGGKPRPLGAAQVLAGVFLFTIGVALGDNTTRLFTLPSVLFVITGMLSYAAGKYPNMHVTKLSFSLNIISFFWSTAATVTFLLLIQFERMDFSTTLKGIYGLIISLHLVENFISVFLIYWLSKAVCRQHFNSLPTIMLKLGD